MLSKQKRHPMDKRNCLEIGNKAELLLILSLYQRGHKIYKATDKQDKYKHIDIFVTFSGTNDETTIQVKSKGKTPEHLVCLQIRGFREGLKGSLFGSKAEWFAIERQDCFVLIKTKLLQEFVKKSKYKDFTHDKEEAQTTKKIYVRPTKGGEDHLVYVSVNEMKTSLSHQIVKKVDQQFGIELK